LAFALGITTDSAHKDLMTMRAIRNAFAHSSNAFTFGHNDLRRALHSLLIIRRVAFKTSDGRPALDLERLKFMLAVCLHCSLLDKHNAKWEASKGGKAQAAAWFGKSDKPRSPARINVARVTRRHRFRT
jgi:hypothetical protein